MHIACLDGALQKIVPTSLRQLVIYLANYPHLQGYLGATRIFNSLRRKFYWLYMANNDFDTVRNYQSCAKTRGALTKSQNHLRLFPANCPFQLVAMDILGPLPKIKSGKRIIVVITDRYSNLTRAIPMNDTTAPLVACFLNNWVFPYGIPN